MTDFDVIVVGAGHNGLVCATLLARAARRVLVLEARDTPGGAATTREFAPGYHVSAPAHLLHSLSPQVAGEMALAQHGLRFAATRMPSIALGDDGSHLVLADDDDTAARSIARYSAADATRYPAFMTRMRRFAAWLRPLLDRSPPGFGADSADRRALLGAGWRLRRLGRRDMRELLRIAGMNVADLLEDEFETDLLRGALAVEALLGSFLGPRSPGSVLSWLVRLAARADTGYALPAGGLGAFSAAMTAAARAAGVTLRCGARVAALEVSGERVSGVRLANGEAIGAPLVVSNADPRQTLAHLAGPAVLDTGLLRDTRNIRAEGVVARLHLALDALPDFTGVDPADGVARLLVAPSLDYLERAFNPVKYGEYGREPAIELLLPTLAEPTLAPAGHHVLSANVLYAPSRARAELAADAGERFVDDVVGVLERHAPGLRTHVIACESMLPADMQRVFDLPGGHWHHAELAFEQFLMLRPLPECAGYRTPLPGLWLCGAGCHPGGDISGRPGRNAARAVLAAGSAA